MTEEQGTNDLFRHAEREIHYRGCAGIDGPRPESTQPLASALHRSPHHFGDCVWAAGVTAFAVPRLYR